MVRTSQLSAGKDATAILVVRASTGDVDLSAWLKEHRQTVEAELLKYGAVLFANFAVGSIEDFDRLVSVFSTKMTYQNRLSPRHVVGDNIFTATERDERFRVPFHNENSKDLTFPGRIWFFCMQPSLRGGETTISDGRQVLKKLTPKTIDRFQEKKIRYVLTFDSGTLDPSVSDAKNKLSFGWQFYFGTEDRSVVEGHCTHEGAEFEWLPSGGLRTNIVRPAIVSHPTTKERVWFNHVSVFASTAKLALKPQAGDESDRQVFYGDGTPIAPEVIDEVERAYVDGELCLPWQKGSVLLVDNFLAAHGRNPFEGERKIYVAMTDQFTTTR